MCTKFELVKKGMLGTLDIMLKENLKFVIKRRGVNHASLLSCSHVTASGIKRHYAAFVECVVVKREREEVGAPDVYRWPGSWAGMSGAVMQQVAGSKNTTSLYTKLIT